MGQVNNLAQACSAGTATCSPVVCPPRSYVVKRILPMTSSSEAGDNSGTALSECEPAHGVHAGTAATHSGGASACAVACARPSASAATWSCLHCPGQGTTACHSCARGLCNRSQQRTDTSRPQISHRKRVGQRTLSRTHAPPRCGATCATCSTHLGSSTHSRTS